MGTYIKGVMFKSWIFKIVRFKFTADGDLRGRELEGYEAVLAQVEKQYQITVEAIRELGQ